MNSHGSLPMVDENQEAKEPKSGSTMNLMSCATHTIAWGSQTSRYGSDELNKIKYTTIE